MAARKRSGEEDAPPPLAFVPTRVFFVTGTGVHEKERVATQHAMRAAGVERSNLLKVSSVIPPGCEIISEEEGRRLLRPGNIVFAVIAEGQTSEPHQRVAPALAWAKPVGGRHPGFIAEVEEDLTKGKTVATACDMAGQEVLEILAEELRVKIDPERLWDRRRRSVRLGRTEVEIGCIGCEAVAPEERDGKTKTAAAFVAAIYL